MIYLIVLIFSSALSLTMVRKPVIFLAVSGDDGFVNAHILSYSRFRKKHSWKLMKSNKTVKVAEQRN